MSNNSSNFFGNIGGADCTSFETQEKDSFHCPYCDRDRYGEKGILFDEDILCVSCIEGLVEE